MKLKYSEVIFCLKRAVIIRTNTFNTRSTDYFQDLRCEILAEHEHYTAPIIFMQN